MKNEMLIPAILQKIFLTIIKAPRHNISSLLSIFFLYFFTLLYCLLHNNTFLFLKGKSNPHVKIRRNLDYYTINYVSR